MDRLNAWNRLPDGGRLLVENPQAADLDAPLTNSIIPQRGVGAVSYTRATIATVTDHEWVIRNCLSGEARFQGARRVQNLYTYSQDPSNAAWTAVLCAKQSNVTTAPDGTLTADRVQTNASTALMEMFQNLDVVAWKTYTYSAHVKYHNWRYIQLVGNGLSFGLGYINIDIQTGAITSTTAWAGNFSGTITSVWNWWYRVSVTATCISTAAAQHLSIAFINNASDVRIAPAIWDGTSGYYIWGIQFEDVTGQSIQTPSEYVSTNVLTTAPFHGSNVDGVKCFNTTLAWLPISPSTLKGFLCEWTRTNICNYSNIAVAWWGLISSTRTEKAWIAPDGSTSMVKIIPNAGTQSSYAYNLNVTTAASVYTISCYVKADWLNFVQLRFGAGISSGFANFDLLNWVVGTRSLWTSSGIEPVSAFPWVYRIWAVTNTVLAATAAIAIQIVPAANSGTGAPVTWDWVSGVMVWGMQIELWTFPSSYIPTGVSGLTRNIDFLSYNVNNVINLKWAVYCEIGINIPWYTNMSWFIIDRWESGRYLYANNSVTWVSNYDWTNILVSNIWSSYNGSVAKIATSWNGSTKSIYYGNTVPKTWSYVGTFWTGNINVGSSWNGTIRNVKVWKEPPTVAELTSITSQ